MTDISMPQKPQLHKGEPQWLVRRAPLNHSVLMIICLISIAVSAAAYAPVLGAGVAAYLWPVGITAGIVMIGATTGARRLRTHCSLGRQLGRSRRLSPVRAALWAPAASAGLQAIVVLGQTEPVPEFVQLTSFIVFVVGIPSLIIGGQLLCDGICVDILLQPSAEQLDRDLRTPWELTVSHTGARRNCQVVILLATWFELPLELDVDDTTVYISLPAGSTPSELAELLSATSVTIRDQRLELGCDIQQVSSLHHSIKHLTDARPTLPEFIESVRIDDIRDIFADLPTTGRYSGHELLMMLPTLSDYTPNGTIALEAAARQQLTESVSDGDRMW